MWISPEVSLFSILSPPCRRNQGSHQNSSTEETLCVSSHSPRLILPVFFGEEQNTELFMDGTHCCHIRFGRAPPSVSSLWKWVLSPSPVLALIAADREEHRNILRLEPRRACSVQWSAQGSCQMKGKWVDFPLLAVATLPGTNWPAPGFSSQSSCFSVAFHACEDLTWLKHLHNSIRHSHMNTY